MTKRILLRNGQLHRGDQFIGIGDLLLEGERILEIGTVIDAAADIVIDATNHIICPGFIDVQNMHDEVKTLERNQAINLITQGITTCIIGNCGRSGPINSPDSFLKTAEFLKKANLGVNIGCLIGHNSLRTNALPQGTQVATSNEIKKLAYLLEETLEIGALGMSSGLMYFPGIFADSTELTALAAILGKHGKVYATHLRDEGDYLVESIVEALNTAGDGNCKLVISHLKATGAVNKGKSHQVIHLIENRQSTQEVYITFYPYTATSTVLSVVILPEVLQKMGTDVSQLNYHPDDEELMTKRGKQNLCLNGWQDVVIIASKFPEVIGKSIADLSNETGYTCYETVVAMLCQDPLTRVIFYNIASEEDTRNIAQQPYAIACTDGYIYPLNSKEATHPRNYGAIPTALYKYTINEALYSLEEFIRKSSMLSARVYRIKDRGMLTRGYYADILVFRPNEIRVRATYEQPFLLSEGMAHVFVNGEPVLMNNQSVGTFSGKFIE